MDLPKIYNFTIGELPSPTRSQIRIMNGRRGHNFNLLIVYTATVAITAVTAIRIANHI